MASDLEQLLGQVQSFKAGSDQATQQVLSALGSMTQLSNANADTLTQAATDNSTVTAAQQAAAYQTQLARVKAANIAGANLNDQSEVLSGLSAAATDAQTRKDQALAAIQDKDSVSFMDNPLQYLVNQFTVNGDISKYNIANAQLESAHSRIMEVNAEAQQTATTQNAISEPLTAASMEASTRLAAAQATVQARDAQIQGLNYGTKGIEFALNANKDTLALGFQAEAAKRAEQQTQISLQQLDLQKKEFAERQKEYQERQDDRDEQRAMGQSVIDSINLGRKALLGPNASPIDDMSGKMVLATLKGKGTLSAELQAFYDAGERTKLTGKTSFGATPAQAAANISNLPVQLNPTQGPIKNILSAAAADTNNALKMGDLPGQQKNPVFVGIDKKDRGSINAAMSGRAQQILDGYSQQVKPGDVDNPYQIASVNQLAANSPTIQQLPLYQKVFAPLVKNGVQLNDPKQIFSIVANAAANGQITHQEALGLTTIYHVGISANLAMRNFTAFGLVPKNSYNAQVETDPRAFHSDEVINLTDPMAVSRGIMKLQASKMTAQMIQQATPATGGQATDTPKSGEYQFSMPDVPYKFGPATSATPFGNPANSQQEYDKASKAMEAGFNQPLPFPHIRRTSYER